MENLRASYLSAGEMPWKLLRARDAVSHGKVRPVHFSLSPTNRCNANCSWCSCRDVDRTLSMDSVEAVELIDKFAYHFDLGAEALTITGGGEPTLHDGLGSIVEAARNYGLRVALITNGLRWAQEGVPKWANTFDWIRVSILDRDYDAPEVVQKICVGAANTKVGVTFTVTDSPNLDWAQAICRLADDRLGGLTHIRFVQDILSPSDEGMHRIQNAVDGITERALLQYRDQPTPGTNPCWVSRLKPYVDADGSVYPCCGVQYATDQTRTLPKSMRMCHWSDYDKCGPLDGSVCKRCHYGEYNHILAGLVAPIEHKEFV